jgi:hypothetical protein
METTTQPAIKASELRIGNWLHLKNSDFIKVDVDNIADVVNNPAIFNPIQLTPEILEKCGFEDKGSGYLTKSIDEGGAFLMCEYGGVSIYHNIEECSFNFPGKYLHQLQNLFFALTGTELTINL